MAKRPTPKPATAVLTNLIVCLPLHIKTSEKNDAFLATGGNDCRQKLQIRVLNKPDKRGRYMKKILMRAVVVCTFALAAIAAFANVWVPKGTQVSLAFDEAISSKNAKVGDTVKMHVIDDVLVNNKTVLAAGTPVTGIISSVRKRAHFGVNAKMQITLQPVQGITLTPRTTGKQTGSRPDHAAEISGAGALVLGPIGLVGGYFVVGKSVEIKEGDRLETEVSKNVTVH
jgi:hypothetical protein